MEEVECCASISWVIESKLPRVSCRASESESDRASPLMVLFWSASADHMRVCQSGLARRSPLIAFRGDDGGEVDGDWGIYCHWAALTTQFSLIMRRFGDLASSSGQ